jgi:hypothetical protein
LIKRARADETASSFLWSFGGDDDVDLVVGNEEIENQLKRDRQNLRNEIKVLLPFSSLFRTAVRYAQAVCMLRKMCWHRIIFVLSDAAARSG